MLMLERSLSSSVMRLSVAALLRTMPTTVFFGLADSWLRNSHYPKSTPLIVILHA
jgi:hypothetical protein